MGEKYGDEEEIFNIISKYINNGYIEYLGEDGDRWRFIFANGTLKIKHAEVTMELEITRIQIPYSKF